jgi:hypothetical protein
MQLRAAGPEPRRRGIYLRTHYRYSFRAMTREDLRFGLCLCAPGKVFPAFALANLYLLRRLLLPQPRSV